MLGQIISAFLNYKRPFKDDAVTTDVLGNFDPSKIFQIDAMLKEVYVDQSKIRQGIHNTVISTTE